MLRLLFSGKNKTLRALFGNKNTIATLAAMKRMHAEAAVAAARGGAVGAGSAGGAIDATNVDGGADFDGAAASALAPASAAPLGGTAASHAAALLHDEPVAVVDADDDDEDEDEGDGSDADDADAGARADGGATSQLGAAGHEHAPSLRPTVRTSSGAVSREALARDRAELRRILEDVGVADARANALPLATFLKLYTALTDAGWRFAKPGTTLKHAPAPTAAAAVVESADAAAAPADAASSASASAAASPVAGADPLPAAAAAAGQTPLA